MKKLIALILVLSMVFALCGCGNSKEIKAIMEVKRSLLRPDTFILRYAYSFSGCPFEEETDFNYDKLKDIKVNLEIFFYTCENASGTVIDNCCALYDMDSGIVYYDLEETKKFLSGKGAWDCVAASRTLFAGYPHIYLAGCPKAAERLAEACRAWQRIHRQDSGKGER